MSFVHPEYFWLLLPLVLVFLWARKRWAGVALELPLQGENRGPRSLRQILRPGASALGFLGLAALLAALARPQQILEEEAIEREGIAIMMLVDVSSSMDMRIDYRGEEATRLTVAKEVLERFVKGDGEKLNGRPDDLIGIVTFARYADTICPLTLSHDAVVHFARELKINDRPNEDGTAYGDAAALGAARLETLEKALWERSDEGEREIKSKVIVLLTDGENNCGRHLPLESAALAREWGIRLYTISLTDPPRTRRLGTGDDALQVAAGTSAAEQTLERMAEMTGGLHRTAHDFDSLQAVYGEIDELERSDMHSVKKKTLQERFGLFALASVGLLGIESLLRSTWLRRAP